MSPHRTLYELQCLVVKGKKCFDSEKVDSYFIAGVTSTIHIILPIMFTVFLSILILMKKLDIGTYIPALPIFTKLYATILDWKLFKLYTTDPKERKTTWNKKKEDLIAEQDTNERVINLSMINEAALESSFQVRIIII